MGQLARTSQVAALLKWNSLSNSLSPAVLAAVLRRRWLCKHSQEYARGIVYRTVSSADYRIVYPLTLYASFHQGAFNGKWSDEQEALAWKFSVDLLHAYSQTGKFTELQAFRGLMAWTGSTGLLGWGSLAPGLDRSLRADGVLRGAPSAGAEAAGRRRPAVPGGAGGRPGGVDPARLRGRRAGTAQGEVTGGGGGRKARPASRLQPPRLLMARGSDEESQPMNEPARPSDSDPTQTQLPSHAGADAALTRPGPADGEADPGADLGFLAPADSRASRPARPLRGPRGHRPGGHGRRLQAFDPALQRRVAIKVLAAGLATSPARKRFLREARAAAAVRHDDVVAVHAVEERPACPTWSCSTSRASRSSSGSRRGRPLLEAVRLLAEAPPAWPPPTSQGLIHRDIKPANILLETAPRRVKITDFGLARAADDASLTRRRAVAGTPLYMAPEQAQGEPLDHRADLFSLGSVLYAMCTGRPPFRGRDHPRRPEAGGRGRPGRRSARSSRRCRSGWTT